MMIDALFWASPDLYSVPLGSDWNEYKGVKGVNNRPPKTYEGRLPPNPLGRHPFNILTEEIYNDSP